MNSDGFWALIDATRPPGPDADSHAESLIRRLVALDVDQTRQFVSLWEDAMSALNRWDLWGAAYLALGGCGDDAFEYLRAWIIGQGRSVFDRARGEAEQLFVDLLAGSTDPDERWDEIGIHDGEPLLYAGGRAHETLTGRWPPPSATRPTEPDGEEWEEEELPAWFPRLLAALPDGWWDLDGENEAHAEEDPVLDDVIEGLQAAGDGDHRTATDVLSPLLDHSWEHLASLGLSADVAYAVGVGRLLDGDVEGARAALERVDAPEDHIRRALAQIELAVGNLTAAERLLDPRLEAHLFDRALGAVLAQRIGRRDDALALADSVLGSATSEPYPPWDAAGAALQVGLVLVELDEYEGAAQAASLVENLTHGAPDTLPLVDQGAILSAGALRLEGDTYGALERISETLDRLKAADLAGGLREVARCHAALGEMAEARSLLADAIDHYRGAGEAWMASDAERELATWGNDR